MYVHEQSCFLYFPHRWTPVTRCWASNCTWLMFKVKSYMHFTPVGSTEQLAWQQRPSQSFNIKSIRPTLVERKHNCKSEITCLNTCYRANVPSISWWDKVSIKSVFKSYHLFHCVQVLAWYLLPCRLQPRCMRNWRPEELLMTAILPAVISSFLSTMPLCLLSRPLEGGESPQR